MARLRPVASDPTRPQRQALIRLLVDGGKIDEAALARAELVAAGSQLPTEQVLNQLGSLSDDDLVAAYATVTGLPVWTPDPRAPIDVPSTPVATEFLRRRRTVPIEWTDGALTCATCDPLDPETVEGLAFAAGVRVELLIARPADWRRAFDVLESSSEAAAVSPDRQRLEREIDQVADLGATSPGARLVASAFEAAIKFGASDIHFEPRRNDLRVRLRVDGQMIEHQSISADHASAAVSRVKVIANLDVGERRLPQDGRTSFVFGGRSIDVRVATSPTVFGESAVLRILDRTSVPLDLQTLGLDEGVRATLLAASAAPHGMFLISGPTGSGKTTTLYALLQSFAGSPKKVLSVEDPVEYHFEHVTQTQVAPQIGLTFASALRSFLRQDPDVILVGEIRDPETASVAVQAAMTGHLVLASVHANDAVSVIARLLDMGVEPFQLAAGLRGAAAQRLVRRLCPSCRRPRAPTDAERSFLARHQQAPPCALFDAVGCPSCHGQGFKGRIAIAEAFLAGELMARAVAVKAPLSDLADLAREGGLRSMASDAAAKLTKGLTTLDSVMAALHG